MDRALQSRRRRAAEALTRFLQYLEDLERALAQYEPLHVTALLRRRTATHLPRDVREELLMLSRAPRETRRAPLHFLRFKHRMIHLARAGEGLPTAQIARSLEPRAPAGEIRRQAFEDERRPAASHPVDGAWRGDSDDSA